MPDEMSNISNSVAQALRHPFFNGINLVAIVSLIAFGSSTISNLHFRLTVIEKWKDANAELGVKLATLDINLQNSTKELARLQETNADLAKEVLTLRYQLQRDEPNPRAFQ